LQDFEGDRFRDDFNHSSLVALPDRLIVDVCSDGGHCNWRNINYAVDFGHELHFVVDQGLLVG